MGDNLSDHVLLRMEHIHKRFPGVYALNDVSLELRAGEVHALLGENGAGKSTLIKVLGGIYSADEGEIYVDGKKVQINGVKDAQKNGVAIIHQELVLVPHMTVAENIFLGREFGSGILVDHKKMTEDAQALLDAHEMNVNANALIKDLTIAQQQMVEIVKAISYNSKILVMDEATANIDTQTESLIQSALENLMRERTTIMVAHRLSTIQHADNIIVMHKGRIREQGTHQELLALNGIYKKLYELQLYQA